MFETQVKRQPQRVAFINSQGVATTYQQLYQRAVFLQSLIPEGIGPIALYLSYDADLISAILACLALGRPYLPLDPDFPIERNLAITKHAAVASVLVNENEPNFAAFKMVAATIPLMPGQRDQPILLKAQADSVAYILYTSGSTGKPKGVYQNQRGLLHDVMQYSKATHITAHDCLSGIYSAAVNGAIRDMFAALFNGARLVRINPQETGLIGMAQQVAKTGITIFHAIPPLLRRFINSKPAANLLKSIRLCYIAGDRLFTADLQALFDLLPKETVVYNGIGSTECATLYRHWLIDRKTHIAGTVVPVGYAIDERETYLHWREQGLAEVEVQSPYLALGYWQDTELTERTFYHLPERPGWRGYRTGDLVKVLDNDLFVFVGRADSKVKIRGYLVDLSLLEAEFRRFAEVTDAALVTLDDDNETRLIAVLVGDNEKEALIKSYLSQHFSSASMPHNFVWLKALPRLPSYKLDAKKLNALVKDALLQKGANACVMAHGLDLSRDAHSAYFLPVLQLWLKVLKQPDVQLLQKSFAELGGDSLDLLNFFAQLDLILDKPYPAALFSVSASIQDVLDVLRNTGRSLQQRSAEAVNLVVVPPFVGFGWAKGFIEHLTPELRVIMVPTSALYHPIGEPQPELTDVVERLCAYLKECIAIDSVTHFYGVSSGAKPAFFAACELQKQGIKTGTFIVGDCAPVGRAEHFAAERLQAYSWLTSDIPYYHGAVVEIIAALDKTKQLKTFSSLGWWQYCSKIHYLPLLAEHVGCLTAPAVIELINRLTLDGEDEYLSTELSQINKVSMAANNALLTQQNLLAVCLYDHVVAASDNFKQIYGFNLLLARQRVAFKQTTSALLD
ncbi:non-ribosomal peptide synthetase [Rheinheimera sp. UJ51]|uniref:AMP-binding protein n=1 Tax=Rheinheimera sp. UJ51 TaxID=2892446 RepID=UPI001E415330|nr:AMP-binding protein [Rheinheimera sp. UJ51]MCC5450282.1 non-ribosomal peptide synthetase [Rheinheimera sp. UJ51]